MNEEDIQQIKCFELDDGQGFCIQSILPDGTIHSQLSMESDDAIQMAIMILNLFLAEEI